jgi:hypothetical protein
MRKGMGRDVAVVCEEEEEEEEREMCGDDHVAVEFWPVERVNERIVVCLKKSVELRAPLHTNAKSEVKPLTAPHKIWGGA